LTSYQWVVTKERQELLAALDKLPDRSTKARSELIEDAIREYVKAHGSGNPIYTLDQYTKDPHFRAWPSPWASLGTQELGPYSVQDVDDMIGTLTQALENLHLDRTHKRDAELKARGWK
jgi:hypothetical protein